MKNISIKQTLITIAIFVVVIASIASLINNNYAVKARNQLILSQHNMHELHVMTSRLRVIASEVLRISLNSIILEDDDMLLLAPKRSNEFYEICDKLIVMLSSNSKLKSEVMIIKDDYKELFLKVLSMSSQFTEGLELGEDKLIETNKYEEQFLYDLQLLEKSIEDYSESINHDMLEDVFKQISIVNYLIILSILILILVISIILRKKLYIPLAQLVNFSKRVNQDEYSLSKRFRYQYNDEIGTLADSLNKMLDNIASTSVDKTKLQDEINERIILEEKLEQETKDAINANRAKSDFLANMSHEIRTPLNAIHGFVDIIKKSTEEEKTLEYVNIIDNSSKSLLGVIEDILDFSKIESGKLEIDMIDFNTIDEFDVITSLYQAKCSQANITLTLNLQENLPTVLKSDPLRIKQVISNLLSNAIKFTAPYKKIEVNIGYEDGELSVSVKDEGKGISSDKLSHIFEAFSQEDTSTTREYGGTGLGLSISSQLIKLLGGELKVESKLGVGSEFYFKIPVEIGLESCPLPDHNEDIVFVDKKILLVEDNKTNQLFMSVILEDMGIEFDLAVDGVYAVDMFKENHYDLILMDENMPNMNGIEATKNILQIEKDNNLKHTPIIALTANSLKGDRERFLEAGMDEYMTKPIDTNKLANMLNNFFLD